MSKYLADGVWVKNTGYGYVFTDENVPEVEFYLSPAAYEKLVKYHEHMEQLERKTVEDVEEYFNKKGGESDGRDEG